MNILEIKKDSIFSNFKRIGLWVTGYSVLFTLVGTFLNRITFLQGLLFLCYMLFLFFLPGLAITLCIGIKAETDTEWIGYSFLWGYCFDIFLYYCTVPFGLLPYFKWIAVICAVISALIIIGKREKIIFDKDVSGMRICTIGVAVYVLFMFIAYNGTGLTPNLTGESDLYTYHRDVLYWVGNLNSLVKQYPPIDPRNYLKGTYNYHYFSSLQLATVYLFTGIKPLVLCIGFYFFNTTVMIIFGTYLLTKKFFKNDKVTVIAMCALLVTSGVENITKIEWACHFAISAFGTDYGLGLFLFLLLFLYSLCRENETTEAIKQSVAAILLLGIVTGTKGPFGAIALCGMGGVCLFWLVKKKYIRTFIFGADALMVFLLVYYFVCNVKGYASGDSGGGYLSSGNQDRSGYVYAGSMSS